ncbi:MAG: F0F1 ATP synthase subunit delta [Chthoniobacterales bacterium]|jgi:F-type H+-transporting ATPase subunit delta|nr:F0F1 ATP synthase subunit delta [Chthoniobacterales bacterium]MBA3763454.1 F0F1 ATP synthase subunit delta [Chthoniobacterales bacterium]
MKINKEIRQQSRGLLRSSFTDGQLDAGRVTGLVRSLIEKKPRNYIQVLDAYKRLLRLEVEKRTATIESATELSQETGTEIVANLIQKYGVSLDTRFIVNQELLGGMRIRVGSDVWDSSVRNRLQRLQQQL